MSCEDIVDFNKGVEENYNVTSLQQTVFKRIYNEKYLVFQSEEDYAKRM